MSHYPIKVLHIADIQIEVRSQHQRADEFKYVLQTLQLAIQESQTELYLIVGDIFETCRPNDIERSLFIEHLKNVIEIPTLKEVVITYGNHDVDQRKDSNFFISDLQKTPSPNSLDTIISSIASPKIMLLEHSQYYRSNAWNDLVYYNWSQKTKHSEILGEFYNPYDNVKSEPDNVKCAVTLYHDPIYDCIGFDGKKLHTNDKFNKLISFKTPTIFAGDIHQPQCVQFGSKKLIYPGSPVARNFGEGDYYENGRLIQSGTPNHTFSTCLLNEDGTISEQKWIQIPQYRGYSTYEITSEVLPEDIVKQNFVIQNPGFAENLIRVKLPSSSESYVREQKNIIDAIKSQNSDRNINHIYFSFGKSVTLDNASQDDVVTDVKEFISSDRLLEIAKSYIHKQVDASRSIPSEDKKAVEKEIFSLFESELSSVNVRNSYSISLKSMNIHNFMAFGENVDIDFSKARGLTKLSGGNGIGKTTLYKAIKWVLTGYVSQSQNRIKKNENNLTVFNDYLWDSPYTSVSLVLKINDIKFVITRTVTREWKKNVGVEEKSSKEWKSYVASTSQELEITKDGDTFLKNVEADEFLNKIFGGLENLERIVFADQFTLRSFVCSEPQRLCEEILSHIGMNFFEKMMDRYDNLRHTKLGSLSKPSETIDTLNQYITQGTSLIENYDSEIKEKTKDKEKYQKTIDELVFAISEKQSQLYPGISEESISKKITETQHCIDEYESRKNSIEKEIESLTQQLSSGNSIEELKKELESQRMIHESYMHNVSENEINIEKNASSIKELKSGIELAKQKIEKEHLQKISARKEEIFSIKETLTSIKTKTKELKDAQEKVIESIKTEFTDKIKDVVKSIDKISLIKEQQESLLQEYISKIEELKNSEVCPVCKRKLEDHSLQEIQKEIDATQEKVDHTRTVIENCIKKIQENENFKNSLSEELEKKMQNPSEIEEYDKYTKQLEIADKLNSSKTSQLQEAEAILLQEESSLKDAINSSSLISNIKKEIEIYESKSDELEKEKNKSLTLLNECNDLIASLKKQIEQLGTIQQKKDVAEKELVTINSQLELFRRDLKDIDSDKEKLERNDAISKEINQLESKKSISEESRNTIDKEILDLNIEKNSTSTKIDSFKQKIDEVVAYRIAESSLKQYKALLGKGGLPQYVFGLIRPMINDKLNDLLEDVNFRLLFNESNQLVMVDLTKDSLPVRYPSQFSGMQTCFSGLSLLYVNRICNTTFLFDTLFIDEISGQLNSGEELGYESLNYQEELKTLLRKFEGLNIWIVDHVIKDMEEDNLFEVVPTSKGTIIK